MKTFPSLRFFAVFALAASCIFAAASFAQEKSSVYAIRHAKIFTLAGAPIEDGTLLIRDGKIAAVGTDVNVPAGAQIIDAKGLQVYPGLFDPVTTIGLREVSAVGATVDTTEIGPYNPDVVAAEAVLPSSEHIPVSRADGITEVLAVPDSGGRDAAGPQGVFGGQASAIHLAGWTLKDMLIQKSVASVLVWPKIELQSFDPATHKPKPFSEAKRDHEKDIDAIADWMERARHYALAMQNGAVAAYQRDLKLESLVPVARGELPLLVFAERSREIREAVEFCDKQKLKMILAGGDEAYKVKDLLHSKNIPVVLSSTLEPPINEDDPYDRLLTQPGELSAAGVKIAFGSFDNSTSRRLGQYAANAVSHGLPYDEGLKAVTLYPAQIFGLADRLGTLEAGKIANVIVTTGDPLELTTEVRYLFIKGNLTSTDNKHRELYEKYSKRP